MPEEQRLLPSDYTKLLNTDKDIRAQKKGLFTLPEDIIGEQDIGDRKFLVFYFDDDDDYEFVRDILENKHSKMRSHPDLHSKKLVRFLKRGMKRE